MMKQRIVRIRCGEVGWACWNVVGEVKRLRQQCGRWIVVEQDVDVDDIYVDVAWRHEAERVGDRANHEDTLLLGSHRTVGCRDRSENWNRRWHRSRECREVGCDAGRTGRMMRKDGREMGNRFEDSDDRAIYPTVRRSV